MISQRVAALEAEVQCCWQSFLASLAPEPGPERPSLRPAGPGPPGRRQRHGPGPRVPIVHGSSFSANSSHLNTTGYQFRLGGGSRAAQFPVMYEPMPDVVNVPSCSRCARCAGRGFGAECLRAGAVVYLCSNGPLEKLALAQPDEPRRRPARRGAGAGLVRGDRGAGGAAGGLVSPGVAPVLVSVVGTVPALYLAWLAVPGAISQKKPVYGRRVAQWTPVELGMHRVIDAGPMPTYVRRPHDELLRAALDPAVPASRLVVVRGGSSTGKTRAAYEAVAGRLAGWRLDYPLNPAALKERLDALHDLPPPTWKPRPGPAIRCWQKRPRRPRAPGTRSPRGGR